MSSFTKHRDQKSSALFCLWNWSFFPVFFLQSCSSRPVVNYSVSRSAVGSYRHVICVFTSTSSTFFTAAERRYSTFWSKVCEEEDGPCLPSSQCKPLLASKHGGGPRHWEVPCSKQPTTCTLCIPARSLQRSRLFWFFLRRWLRRWWPFRV